MAENVWETARKYGWSVKRCGLETISRAARVIAMQERGDEYINAHGRKYDECFEMFDGAMVVTLVVQAAEKDKRLRGMLIRSRCASYAEWRRKYPPESAAVGRLADGSALIQGELFALA